MARCLQIKIDDLSWAHKKIAGEKLISDAKNGIASLLSATETTAKKLEAKISEEQILNAGKEASMDENFNQRYLEILSKEGDDPLVKLANIKTVANQTSADIQALIDKRAEKAALEENIKKLESLLAAANENDTRAVGRKYFQDLVTANQAGYDALLKVHPEQTKSLEALRITLSQESGGLKSGAMYLGSVLTSPFAALGRKFTPKGISDTVSGFVPDTNDSLAKRQLAEMTQAAIEDMKDKLKTNKSEISSLETKLANGDEKFVKQIQKADEAALKKVITVNTLTVEIGDEYLKLNKPMQEIGRKLNDIKQLDKSIDDFITENNTFTKKVSDWFSRFGVWFKTQSLSEKIQEAQQFKNDLKAEGLKYSQMLKDQMDNLEKNPDLSEPVKSKIKAHIQSQINTVPHSPSNRDKMDHIEAIRQDMKDLRKPKVEVESPRQEVDSPNLH